MARRFPTVLLLAALLHLLPAVPSHGDLPEKSPPPQAGRAVHASPATHTASVKSRAQTGKPPHPGAPAAKPGTPAPARKKAVAPMIRFWRGFRQAGCASGTFRDRLVKEFIPATLKTPGRFGLAAYLVALPPRAVGVGVPDEVALVVYQDEESYQRMNDTPEGKTYQQSHWGLFARDRSLSLVPRTFERGFRLPPERGAAFDVLNRPVDWRSGYTLFYFGLRKPDLTPEQFLRQLHRHVGYVRSTFGPRGLRGYLVLMTGDYEIAFMNWTSEGAMQKAMAAAEGKALVKDAGTILDNHQWTPAKRYDGWLEEGECADVRFPGLSFSKPVALPKRAD